MALLMHLYPLISGVNVREVVADRQKVFLWCFSWGLCYCGCRYTFGFQTLQANGQHASATEQAQPQLSFLLMFFFCIDSSSAQFLYPPSTGHHILLIAESMLQFLPSVALEMVFWSHLTSEARRLQKPVFGYQVQRQVNEADLSNTLSWNN